MVLDKIDNNHNHSARLQDYNNLKTKNLETEISGIKWKISKNEKGEHKVDPLIATDHVSLTSIRRMDKTISADIVAYKLGYKIDLSAKLEVLKEKYLKNFLQARSHNYIVAKFAQLKTAFLMQSLVNLGVTIPELQKMQRDALNQAREENETLFEENEYNEEMIYIIGGSPKKIKKEVKIMQEIRTQLSLQMDKLGMNGFYTEEKVLQKKITACKRIKDELNKEKDNMEYLNDYYFLNQEAVRSMDRNAFERLSTF